MQLKLVSPSATTQQLGSVASATATASSTAVLPGDRSSASGPAELFKQLEALASSDPAKFKQVTAQMAAAVQAAADAATDPQEKQLLTGLAAKFTQASSSGDASGLQPPEGGSPPPGPPPGPPPAGAGDAAQAASGATGTTQLDPADANQDGTVTLQEQAAYDARQAALAEQAYARTQDQSRGERAQALFSTLQQVLAKA